MTERIKQWLPDAICVLVFAVIAVAYFFPADFDGRILYRGDASAGRGAGQEGIEYRDRTGERTRWTNSMFCGMPTYQIAPSYGSTAVLDTAAKAYHLWMPENVWYVFAYLLGFYILLRAFDFRQHLAALGSIVWTLSSYFLVIIAAGHIWKVMALAYLPPMIAGIVLAYRKERWLWGAIITGIFCALEINANHIQMTYYYSFIIVGLVVAFLIDALRHKRMKAFGMATAACALGAVIGLAANGSNLYHTWQYAGESMRGKSELTKANSANQTDSGLERNYITMWSYGIDETMTLMVPNAKGGASVPLTHNATAMAKAKPEYGQVYAQIGQYWGEQPGTSGPVYVGAFVCMLFILSLFIVKGPVKWAMLCVTALSILLSWGHNLMPFTDLFIDYFPMYSKFRTVASILVVAEFTIPLMAMLGLKRIVDEPGLLARNMRWLWVSFALTGGVCLLLWLWPQMLGDVISSQEMASLANIPESDRFPLMANLREMREAMLSADAIRSFWIILIGTLCLLLFKAGKLKAAPMAIALAVLCLVDMWAIDKRYLNDGMFVEASVRERPQEPTPAEARIMQDKDPGYRVLNLASNTFNECETSYYLRSVGGYHAAKLRRYQEMIERYISPQMGAAADAVVKAQGDMAAVDAGAYPVLNMLNTRYFIFPMQGGQTMPIANPYAFGPAWYINKVYTAADANEEIAMVGKIDLRHEAVADKTFAPAIAGAPVADSLATVRMTAQQPNSATYEAQSKTGGVIVFSEIYYPGWTCTVDGQPADIARVNYILRAVKVGPGKHTIVMDFHPRSVATTEAIAYAALALLLLLIGWALWRARK